MTAISAKPRRHPASPKKTMARTFLYLVLILWAVFMLMPFVWMVLTSLKTRLEA
jgi:ABC-type glycerol-3-phosphate transport system permease component